MTKVSKYQADNVLMRIAKEFLECRLGIEASDKNVYRLATHISQFEKECSRHTIKGGTHDSQT